MDGSKVCLRLWFLLGVLPLRTTSFVAMGFVPRSLKLSSFPLDMATSGYDSDREYSTSLDRLKDRSRRQRQSVFEEQGGETLHRGNNLLRRLLLRPLRNLRRRVFPSGAPDPGTLILVRGGESEWSGNYTFTGWADPPLSRRGIAQCEHAGRLLLEGGYEPDIVYASRLKRAICSAWIITQEIGTCFLPIFKSWRLNERHYGSLTGLCKKRTAEELGREVVQSWRRSLKARPPPVERTDPFYPIHDRRYADLEEDQLPLTESLSDCMARTEPLLEYRILRDLRNGNDVLVCAHANTLRGLIKLIDDVSDEDITDVSMPTGIPFVYKFDKCMKPIQPPDGSLTQIHTSGIFLEKPGLLKVALDQELEYDEKIPGLSDEAQVRTIDKGITTLEKSLLRLKEERKMTKNNGHSETESDEPPIHSNEDVRLVGDKNIEPDPEDFEEDVTWRKSSFSNNTISAVSGGMLLEVINNVDIKKDPVVVFIRHGRTPHNQLALFTGWEDPPLAPDGVRDAVAGGKLLKKHGFEFDVVYTSWLTRAIQTAHYVMEELDCHWLPLIKSWRLNERHYGALTGKSKKMIGNIYGEDRLKIWRRSYDVPPPDVSSYSRHYPGNDYRLEKYIKDMRYSLTETLFRSVQDGRFQMHRKFPKAESLKTCMDRSIPFYTEKIVPEAVAKGKRVLIASHENAIRGILMHLCDIPPENMNELHLPNGVPLVYNVRRRCITLLDDGTGRDPLQVYDFGSAAPFLFKPCELLDEDFEVQEGAIPTEKEETLLVASAGPTGSYLGSL